MYASVPEARNPINPTLSDWRERSVGNMTVTDRVPKARYKVYLIGSVLPARRDVETTIPHTCEMCNHNPHFACVGLIG